MMKLVILLKKKFKTKEEENLNIIFNFREWKKFNNKTQLLILLLPLIILIFKVLVI